MKVTASNHKGLFFYKNYIIRKVKISEPPPDRHNIYTPAFTGKRSPCTGKKYSRWYHIPAKTERVVCFAGESVPWVHEQVKLWLKTTSDVDQHAKQWILTVNVTPGTPHARTRRENYKLSLPGPSCPPPPPPPPMDRSKVWVLTARYQTVPFLVG